MISAKVFVSCVGEIVLKVAVLLGLFLAGTLASHRFVSGSDEVRDLGPRPVLICVGAKWCPACQSLEKKILKMRGDGALDGVCLLMADVDENKQLAKALMRGSNLLPQLVLLKPVYRLVGNCEDKEIEKLLSGVGKDQTNQKE